MNNKFLIYAESAQQGDTSSSSVDADILKGTPDLFQCCVFVSFSPHAYNSDLIGTDCPQS